MVGAMPKTIRNGRYGRTNGKPRRLREPRRPRGPRLRVAPALNAFGLDRLKRRISVPDDLVTRGLRGLCELVAEWLQERAQGLARHELRDDGVRPDWLIRIGDEAPALPDQAGGCLHRLRRVCGEVRVLA